MCRLCSRLKCVVLVLLLCSNLAKPQRQSQTGFRLGSNDGGSCASYWSIQSDSNGKYGLLSIPNPDRSQNVLKIQLTLAAKISVR